MTPTLAVSVWWKCVHHRLAVLSDLRFQPCDNKHRNACEHDDPVQQLVPPRIHARNRSISSTSFEKVVRHDETAAYCEKQVVDHHDESGSGCDDDERSWTSARAS